MPFKEEQEVSTAAKRTLAENGIFDMAQEEEPSENDLDSDDSEPVQPGDWEDGVDPNLNLNDESWIGIRGPNKNPTRGVFGTKAGPKRTQASSKGTQAGPKRIEACPNLKGTQAEPKTTKK